MILQPTKEKQLAYLRMKKIKATFNASMAMTGTTLTAYSIYLISII
ncbi:hypothetical protein [Vibrio harveyi]|nr:hypothetical protein [Vibrio harveyi]